MEEWREEETAAAMDGRNGAHVRVRRPESWSAPLGMLLDEGGGRGREGGRERETQNYRSLFGKCIFVAGSV